MNGKNVAAFLVAGSVEIGGKKYMLTLNGDGGLTPGSNRFVAGDLGHSASFSLFIMNGPFESLDRLTGYLQLATDHKSGSFSFQYQVDGGSSPKPGSFKGAFTCS